MLDIPRTPVEKNAVMSERAAPRAPPEHPSQLGLTEVGCGFDAVMLWRSLLRCAV